MTPAIFDLGCATREVCRLEEFPVALLHSRCLAAQYFLEAAEPLAVGMVKVVSVGRAR